MGKFKKLLLGLSLIPRSLAFIPVSTPQNVDQFDWDMISPSWDLKYHPCYDGLECARLLVPLDWQNASNPNTVALAIAKLSAKVSSSDSRFGGTIIHNPGGPGVSGVQAMIRFGKGFQKVVDMEDRFYDILSFDPRGIWKTSPAVDCFEGDHLSMAIWDLQQLTMGNIDTGDRGDEENAVLKTRLAAAKAIGQLCQASTSHIYDNGDNILEYISTPAVARDMLAIVEKIDELESKPRDSQVVLSPKLPKLQYWGLSYGTILGNVFASLFPDRVERMILDAVVDGYDYMSTSWLKNLQDVEPIVKHFYQSCYEAGPLCALYNESSPPKSSDDIKHGIDSIREQLRSSPVPILRNGTPSLFTLSDFELLTSSPWYSPLTEFPRLAIEFAKMLAGDYQAVNVNSRFPIKSGHPKPRGQLEGEPITAILCSDGKDIRNKTALEVVLTVRQLHYQSPMMAGFWAQITTACTGWPFRGKWRFEQPFSSPSPGSTAGPAAPLLFLSTEYDPVTPLANAVEMSKSHPQSVVVAQRKSYGHGALWSQPSNCTSNIIKKYFADGVVPKTEDGEIVWCEADCWSPWDENCSSIFYQ